MGYTVFEPGLAAYAGLLERQDDYLDKMNRCQDSVLSGDTGTGSTVFSSVSEFQEAVLGVVTERQGYVGQALRLSAEGLRDAVKEYREQEDRNEAQIDATYGAVADDVDRSKPDIPFGRKETPDSLFDDIADVAIRVDRGLDTDSIDEAAGDVDRWISDKLEYFSNYSWIDWAIRGLTGWSLRTAVVDAVVGDWRGFARTAQMWKNYGAAQRAISENLFQYKFLNYFWEGNAADAALLYFRDLAVAAHVEADLYKDYLHPAYWDIVAKIRDAQQAVDGIVGLIVDTITTLGIGLLVKSPKALKLIEDAIDVIGDIWGGTKSVIDGYKAVVRELESDGAYPCLMEKVLYPNGRNPMNPTRPRGYRHPGT